jgi:hypothetical protein
MASVRPRVWVVVGCSCVDYDEVVAAFFHPSPEGIVPPPVAGASPARRLRDAIEPIAMHAVWSRRTNERLAGLGLDFFAGYVWGRAAALGEPAAGVVVSSFAVFEPGMLAAVYEQGRTSCSRDDLVAERAASTIDSLHEVLGGADVAPIAERLAGAVTTVATASVTGRPLFAGLAGQPWPDDPYGRLWRACELLREHRGDGHIAACIAAGLGPVAMNVLTELWVGMPLGSYSATRGWTAEQIAAAAEDLRVDGLLQGDELSTRGRTWRDGLEATTDDMERAVVDAIGDGFDPIVTQLDEWSAQCIAADAFPPDAFKRAAG